MGSKAKPPDESRDRDGNEREMAWAKGLKARYDKVAQQPVPDRFRDLLRRIDDADSRER
jgi:hypothetical protein